MYDPFILLGVTWLDAATHSGWRDDADELGVSTVYSMGFLIGETDICVKLAATISADGQPADITAIPKRSITKRHKLKV